MLADQAENIHILNWTFSFQVTDGSALEGRYIFGVAISAYRTVRTSAPLRPSSLHPTLNVVTDAGSLCSQIMARKLSPDKFVRAVSTMACLSTDRTI